MKTFLRWIGFLPAAVAAYFLIQFANALIPIVPDVLIQWWNSWASAIGFIFVGCYIAPKFKKVIGIVLSIIVCVSVVFTFIIHSNMPLWDIIVNDIFTLVAGICGFSCGKALEYHEKRLNGTLVEEKEVIIDHKTTESIAESDRAWKQLQKHV